MSKELEKLAIDVAVIQESTKNTLDIVKKQDKSITKFFSIIEGEDGVITRMVLNTVGIKDNKAGITRLHAYLITVLLAMIAILAEGYYA